MGGLIRRDTVKNQSNADAASALKGTEYDVTGNLVWDVLTQAGLDQNLIVMVMSVTGTVIVGNDGDVQTRDPTMTFEQITKLQDFGDAKPLGAFLSQKIQDESCSLIEAEMS